MQRKIGTTCLILETIPKDSKLSLEHEKIEIFLLETLKSALFLCMTKILPKDITYIILNYTINICSKCNRVMKKNALECVECIETEEFW